jgi:5-methylcytosine-specific restriction enzyme A
VWTFSASSGSERGKRYDRQKHKGDYQVKKALCPFPGCMAIVVEAGRYCGNHAHLQAEKDRKAAEWATRRWQAHHERIDYAAIWHTPRWRKMRAAQLKAEPNCVRCGAPAKTVDHIIPHRGDLELAYSAGNLQSLCSRCSNIKSREDRDHANPYPPRKNQERK